MRTKTELSERPPEFTVAREGTKAVIIFYTDVVEEEREESVAYSAISWMIERTWTPGLEDRIREYYAQWLSVAQSECRAKAAAIVRDVRDKEIAKTDYLLCADYPISEEDRRVVSAYRQALRDIPEQPGFPFDVEWPRL